jgi:hypothetical protein
MHRCPDIASRFAWNDVVVKAIEDYRAANVTHEETRHDLLSSVADAASMFTNLVTGGAVSGPLRMKRNSELLSHNAQANAGAGSGAGDNNAGNDSDRSPAAGNHVPFQSSSSASPLFPPQATILPSVVSAIVIPLPQLTSTALRKSCGTAHSLYELEPQQTTFPS